MVSPELGAAFPVSVLQLPRPSTNTRHARIPRTMLPSLGATIPAHIVCPSGTRVLADSVVVVVGCRIRCHRTSVDVRDTLAGHQVGPRSYAARRDHFLA